MQARRVLAHLLLSYVALMLTLVSLSQLLLDESLWAIGVVAGCGVLLVEVFRVFKYAHSKWSS